MSRTKTQGDKMNDKHQKAGFAASTNSEKYDHDEVRCDEMADSDCENKSVGDPRTCCVCAGHDCALARAERLKHPARISPLTTELKHRIIRDNS